MKVLIACEESQAVCKALAVLISIRPEWANKIITGEKTVEVRKTRPNLKTPFTCYIYCTKGKLALLREDDPEEPYKYDVWQHASFHEGCGMTILGCKVIGEFVCDRINRITHVGYSGTRGKPTIRACKADNILEIEPDFDFSASCMNMEQIEEYLDGGDGYAWHISNLKIYDTPKELAEFYAWKKCKSCSKSGYESTGCTYDENCMVPAVITKAPQSWRFVEDLNNG